jgi:hypothetical protein
MSTTIINKYKTVIPADAVFIGRPSKWGNPFRIGVHGTRAEVIKKYENWIRIQPQLMNSLHELQDKTLVCYCKPLPCHGDILIKLLGELSSHNNT